jgi:DNA polymerase-3 subunit epsilon
MNGDVVRPAWATRGLPWTRVEFAALDFELTGLDATTDSVISMGVVPVLDGRIVLAGSIYRTVSAESELRSRSIVVHGLLPEDLADAPPIDEARPALASALDGRYLLTWAAEVEAAFLAKLFRRSHRSWLRRSVDVLGLAMLADRLEPTSPGRREYTLESVADRFGISMEQPHHAFDDALTTAQLFLILANRLSRGKEITIRGLLRQGRRGRSVAV